MVGIEHLREPCYAVVELGTAGNVNGLKHVAAEYPSAVAHSGNVSQPHKAQLLKARDVLLHELVEALHLLVLLKYLEKAGLLNNSIVIYTSDHGEMQGEHGLKGKGGNIYENNIHVPLIIYHPEMKGGRHCYNLTSHLDLAPTFVDIATAGNVQQFSAITQELHGHSLMPAVKNPATDIRNSEGALFCFEMISMIDGDYVMNPSLKPAYRADMNKRGFVRGIITPDYKFARYFAPVKFNTPADYEALWADNDVELLMCGTDETENLAWPKDNNANQQLVELMNQKLNALIQREIGTDDGSETKKGYKGGVEMYDKNKYDQ